MTQKNTNGSKFMTNEEKTPSVMHVIRVDNHMLRGKFSENKAQKPDSSAESDRPIVDKLETEIEGGDFRPTTPGHSPGFGHGNGPSSIEKGV